MMQQVDESIGLGFGSTESARGLAAVVNALISTLTNVLGRFGVRINRTLPKDGTEAMLGPLVLMTCDTATLPDATAYAGGVIYVSDGAAGAKFRGSDGSGWVNLG